MARRKSLLIGCNYRQLNPKFHLSGCVQDTQNMAAWLMSRGFGTSPAEMVVMTDERTGPFLPLGRNILAAMDWLVSEPRCSLFLHYSGHGGQVPDSSGDRASGFDDTIVPLDFQENGQITSDTLHRHLVSRLPSDSTLHVLFDCCHSGSALELPFVYRTDADGNVNLLDNIKQGFQLVGEASHLIRGEFSYDSVGEAKHLLSGARDFFRGLQHRDEQQGDGLEQEDFVEDWSREGKTVFMFSGCKDEQTSADATIGGKHVGAMSWAFLQTMRNDRSWNMSYVQILQSTRALLQQNYAQIPQLSCGYQFDLNRPMIV